MPPAHRPARLRARILRRHRRLARLLPRQPARPAQARRAGQLSGPQVSRGPDVELGGTTPDGRAFRTIDDYKQLLLADKDQLARNLARKLLIYATGADIQFADREVVEDLVADAAPGLRLPLTGARGRPEPGVPEQVIERSPRAITTCDRRAGPSATRMTLAIIPTPERFTRPGAERPWRMPPAPR